MRISRPIKILGLAAVAAVAIAGIYFYSIIYSPNTGFDSKSYVLLIPTAQPFETWIESPQADSITDNVRSFRTVVSWKRLKEVKAGRYRISDGMSNNAIINMLRSGNQEALSVRIDNTHNIYELAGKLGKYTRLDSLDFITVFTDENTCAGYGYNSTTIACMIAPNTYDFFWTMTPKDFLDRMDRISRQYWTEERKQLANDQGLDITAATILASIVKAECSRKDEAPKIAGLYLNRLRINMPLQADPTAVFAAGLRGVNRVYRGTTSIDSPYNTYRNTGLPPGPIDFTEKVYLDAVLKPEKHNFLYLCAQPGSTGYHNFSRTYDQHLQYQKEYHDWLNKKGIR